MTNWSPQNNTRLIVTLTVVSVILTVNAFSNHLVSRAVQRIFEPLSYTASIIARLSFGDYVSSRSALLEENQTLRERIAQLDQESRALPILREQYASLSRQLRLPLRDRELTAEVTSHILASPYGTFTINAGTETHPAFQIGDLVLSAEGFVVGTIAQKGATISTVRMALSPGEKHAAVINDTSVTVEGNGRAVGEAHAPREMKIHEGDMVLVPEFRFRPIGIVGSVSPDDSGASQDVLIRLPLSLTTLRYVSIVPR
ncbi:hypothetical protein EBR66_03105 [bacterium]|nr:hypothetical protein [bacterium]